MALDLDELTSNVTCSAEKTVVGNGIFDKLMETVTEHIEAQYQKGSITGTQFSEVYLGALQAVLSTSSTIFLDSEIRDKEAERIAQQTALLAQQTQAEADRIPLIAKQLEEFDSKIALIGAQKTTEDLKHAVVTNQAAEIAAKTQLIESQKNTEDLKDDLVAAQTLGFKTDAKQKVLSKMLEAWGFYYSVAKEGDPPNTITTPEIDAVKDSLLLDLE